MRKWLVKLAFNGIVTVPALLWFSSASIGQAIFFSLILSTVAFFVGDQIILPLSNNFVATVADFGLAAVMLWAAERTYLWGLSTGEIFITAILLAVVEWMFHRVLGNWDVADKAST